MGEVVFRSKVRIEGLGGPDRAACLPAETDPVVYGMHGEVAEHYKVPVGAFAPHATTLDHAVGVAGG